MSQYSTVEEIVAIFNLPTSKAEQLLAKTVAVLKHGNCEPHRYAKKQDRIKWVSDGLDKLAGVSPQRSHLY
jgi:hypothetical protein